MLTTRRLRLEPNATKYSDAMWLSASESMNELRPWLYWTASASLEEVVAWAKVCETNWAENKAWTFAILFEDRPIGTIGIEDVDAQTLRGELGYWLHSDFAGKGVMTEAGAAVIEFGFEQIGLHRLQLEAGTENTGSIKVAEKLGFQREGVARHSCRGAFGFYDAVRFGLLATDPRPPLDA
ncbi:MAG: GNAT family N-acetyltransferase [Actinomycetota bacterium]|nr:GNAT family N-acetyltransferase [Actinomycetota bacterium]